jgi:hypothetical protein
MTGLPLTALSVNPAPSPETGLISIRSLYAGYPVFFTAASTIAASPAAASATAASPTAASPARNAWISDFSSIVRRQSSVIHLPSSVIHRLSSIVRCPSSVIHPPSSVIRHQSSFVYRQIIRSSSFRDCFLLKNN